MSELKTDKGRVILLIAALASLGPLSIDMYLPAFPQVELELRASSGAVAATLATFFAGLCLGQLLYGPLSDRIGRRKPLLFGLLIYVIASIGCAFAPNVETLLVLRFVQALGSCSGMVVGRALIRDLFPPQETARVFSLVMLCMGIAPILAPLVGQAVSEHLGWRAIFVLCAGFAIMALWATSRVVPKEKPENVKGFDPREMLAMLTHRGFVGYAFTGALIQAGLFAYITGSPNFYINELGYSPQQYSFIFGLNAVGLIAASQWNNVLLRTRGFDQVIRGVVPVASVGALLLATRELIHLPMLATELSLFVFVASLGFVFPNSTAGALAEQGERAGSASALLGLIQYGGAAIASAAVGRLHAITPLSMEFVIVGCALSSLVVFHLTLRERT